MTRIQKIKKFVNDYKVEIISYSALTAFTVAVTYVAAKQQKALNEWIQEQYLAGNVVHQLIDGSYIAVKYTANTVVDN